MTNGPPFLSVSAVSWFSQKGILGKIFDLRKWDCEHWVLCPIFLLFFSPFPQPHPATTPPTTQTCAVPTIPALLPRSPPFSTVSPHTLISSHPHTLIPSYPHTLTPSHPHTLTPSHPHIPTRSQPHTLTPSHPHTLTPSHPHTLIPSHPHTLIPSHHGLPHFGVGP